MNQYLSISGLPGRRHHHRAADGLPLHALQVPGREPRGAGAAPQENHPQQVRRRHGRRPHRRGGGEKSQNKEQLSVVCSLYLATADNFTAKNSKVKRAVYKRKYVVRSNVIKLSIG